MAVSESSGKNPRPHLLRRVFQLRVATIVMWSLVVAASAIAVVCFTGGETLSQLFAHLRILPENLPIWLEVPEVSSKYYLLAPTVVLCLISLAVVKISPQPRTWSRVVVVSIILALTIRYLLWRALSTLNLSNPLDSVLSLGLFFMELLFIFSNSLQLYFILKEKSRHSEADKMAVAVIDGSFIPSVDILIPTYNEPTSILRRTIVCCQALEYANKKIYILDDTKRKEMQNLARELGCEYIARPDNHHAKAGNLNNALTQTCGELIVVFDADFVPTKNFLTRTVGFFQDKKLALVQTNLSFYNDDTVARNLGLEDVLTTEAEFFYSHYQVIRDGVEATVCYGSSFVVRRSALEEVGGFVTGSLSEDYFTGIRITAKGYRFIYLDEKLSAGLAAANMEVHLAQQLRWSRGTLQAFFVDSSPLTIPRLRPLQRLAHLEGLLHWFSSIPRVVFLLMPLAYSFLGIIPMQATFSEVLYFFLPYYLFYFTVFSWLNKRSRSVMQSEVYSSVHCFPLMINVIQVMLSPFSETFKVSPKGVSSNRYVFNWALAWPLIVVFIATAVSLGRNLAMFLIHTTWANAIAPSDTDLLKGMVLGLIWSSYNLLMIGIALLILVDVPKPEPYEWFELRRIVRLDIAQETFWGVTTKISEIGAQVTLTNAAELPSVTLDAPRKQLSVKLEIMGEGLELPGQITQISFAGEVPRVQVAFEQLSLPQYRHLVEMLFCRPGQWKRRETPGELRSLWLLLTILPKKAFSLIIDCLPTRKISLSE